MLSDLYDCPSYQTRDGIVNGIQWVPGEATYFLPAGAQPATVVSTVIYYTNNLTIILLLLSRNLLRLGIVANWEKQTKER